VGLAIKFSGVFSWFASAYDTDDWPYRLATLVQMTGVLILSLGLHDMFASLEEGELLDNRVMVLGYVVMRVPMVFQWLRVARQDPERRSTAMTYVASIVVSQTGWCLLIVPSFSIPLTFLIAFVLIGIELTGPALAELRKQPTPWHPHHIAERYGLLIIIALGEGMIGTMLTMTTILNEGEGWSLDFIAIGLAGVLLVFGLWWTYFVVPSGDLLAAHRERMFGWGYGHIPLFGAVVGVGAGLHVAAYYLEHETKLGVLGTVLAVAVPVAIYQIGLYVLYAQLTRTVDPFHWLLIALTVVVLAVTVGLAAADASLALCLLVLALTPWVTVVGYELRGHQHNARVLAAARAEAG
jgi:low temperature requirement protein LtrA